MSASTPQTHSPEADGDLAEFGYRQELNRTLSTADLLIYGLVFMVPIAPWAIFGVVYNEAKGMVPLVYLIGLVAMIFTALSYAQMSKAFPIAGSVYAYVGRGLNKHLGFLAGWTILLDYLLVPTLLYVFAAESMAGIFPGVPKWAWIVLFLVINTGVNYIGISFTAIVNRVFLAAELLFIVIFLIMAIVAVSKGVHGAAFTTKPLFDAAHFTPGLAATALSIAVLSLPGLRRHRDPERGGQGRSTGRQASPWSPGSSSWRRSSSPRPGSPRCWSRTRPPSVTRRSTTPSSASCRASATTGGRWRSSP